jgi:hypothetical protein
LLRHRIHSSPDCVLPAIPVLGGIELTGIFTTFTRRRCPRRHAQKPYLTACFDSLRKKQFLLSMLLITLAATLSPALAEDISASGWRLWPGFSVLGSGPE